MQLLILLQGYSYQDFRSEYTNSNFDAFNIQTIDQTIKEEIYNHFFGRIANFANKYLLTLLIQKRWFFTFCREKTDGIFPAAALSTN
jgi:hypothetical protein